MQKNNNSHCNTNQPEVLHERRKLAETCCRGCLHSKSSTGEENTVWTERKSRPGWPTPNTSHTVPEALCRRSFKPPTRTVEFTVSRLHHEEAQQPQQITCVSCDRLNSNGELFIKSLVPMTNQLVWVNHHVLNVVKNKANWDYLETNPTAELLAEVTMRTVQLQHRRRSLKSKLAFPLFPSAHTGGNKSPVGSGLRTDLGTIESWTGVSGRWRTIETVQVRGSVGGLKIREEKKEAGRQVEGWWVSEETDGDVGDIWV